MTIFITFVLLVLASLVASFRSVREVSQETFPGEILSFLPDDEADGEFPSIFLDEEYGEEDPQDLESNEPVIEPLKEAA